jgi:hypothetical protein
LRNSHKKATHIHDEVAALLTFSPSSLQKTALQNELSKSIAHRCALNVFSNFSTLTGEAVSVIIADEQVSCSCLIL